MCTRILVWSWGECWLAICLGQGPLSSLAGPCLWVCVPCLVPEDLHDGSHGKSSASVHLAFASWGMEFSPPLGSRMRRTRCPLRRFGCRAHPSFSAQRSFCMHMRAPTYTHTHTHRHGEVAIFSLSTHTHTDTEKWPYSVYPSAFASNLRSINLSAIANLTGYAISS